MSTKANRTLETILDAKGRETARTMLEKPGKVDQMFISPNRAIPVIFVPGIMGSPLIAMGDNKNVWKKQGKWAWFPDGGVSWVVNGYGNLKPHLRKRLLNPAQSKAVETSREADEKTLKAHCKTFMPWQEAARRGWGSVMLSSYSGILHFLEDRLRHILFRGDIHPFSTSLVDFSSQWGELKGYRKLTQDELRRAGRWRFPVYAAGYNWMDSNAAAAEHLKRRIDAIRQDCRERLKVKCDKVILVTHSMGGLVARLCAKRYPQDVLGVVHGVQPAIGAGTAYARVRGGWESNGHVLHPAASLENWVGALSLGATGWEVSAVFASGAGPLELLPNHLYGNGWLRVQYGKRESSAKTLFSLPQNGDPYGEIYADHKHWWRLVHPGCLIESKAEEKQGSESIEDAWRQYKKQLLKAKSFHQELGSYYHPQTYAHCGDDTGNKAWHRVAWRLEPLREITTGLWASSAPSPEAIREAELTEDRMSGTCGIRNAKTAGDVMYERNGKGVTGYSSGDCYRAWLSGQDDGGDATVPAHSGLAPRPHVPFFARMNGFEHQGSCNELSVQTVTLHSILSIAKDASLLT